MNRVWISLILAVTSCGGLNPDRAQSQEMTVLRKAPAGTSWSVKIERPAAGKTKEEVPPVESVDGVARKPIPVPVASSFVMKNGRNGVSLGAVTYSDGTQEAFYVANGLLLTKASNSDKIAAVAPSNNDLFSMKVAGFPGTAWITPLYEKGMQVRGEQECHYFLYDVPPGDPERPAMKIEAWIQKNGYPLEIVIHGEVIYRFGPVTSFDQDIPLPGVYTNVIAKKTKQRAALDLIRKANAKQ